MTLSQKISGFIELARPLEWSKTFGNMIIAALLASTVASFDFNLFFLGFFAAGICLWSGLYALNDWSDWKKDKEHKIKSSRPIPSGIISPRQAMFFSFFLVLISFLIGLLVLKNQLLVLCLLAMLINQLLYTLEPFNFKKLPVIDLVSGSLVNPFFRFLSGWALFSQSLSLPWLMVLFVVGIQFGGYTLYRLSSKEHEKELGYKSSIVLFGEKTIKAIAYLGVLVAGLAYIWSCLSNVLPFKFIWLAIASVLLLPLYWTALTDPQKMNVKKVYNLIYLHNILFILGFILLYFLF